MSINNPPPPEVRVPGVPAPKPGAGPGPKRAAPTTDLEILETLAQKPVAEHLAIFDQLQASLAADLESTSQEQP